LGSVFVGLDPFYLALSRVLHLDALLTTFVTLSVLSLMVYVRSRPKLRYLLFSALTGGLAIASKSPGLFLGPWATIVILTSGRNAGRERREGTRAKLKAIVLWGVIAMTTVVLLWPVLWVDPVGALGQVLGQALIYVDTPHWHSNFFWGQIRPDPGPAFYPVAWAFRTTPWVALGLLMVPLVRGKRGGGFRRQSHGFMLGGFVLAYVVLMTLGAKKFDRYLLPAFPFLDLLAAVGWAELLHRWLTVAKGYWKRWIPALLVLVLAMAQFAELWPTRPYYFSYYSPLLGGARSAQRMLLVGWGEGLERAASYLNALPGAEHLNVSTEHVSQFSPFFRGRTSAAKEFDVSYSDYIVIYVNTVQRWRVPEVLKWFHEREKPDHVISVNGADYVWIYGNTPLREALAYIDERADPTTDCIVLDKPSAVTRQYAGPVTMSTLDGSANEIAIVQALAKATDGRKLVWYITFPEHPGDESGVIQRLLESQADLVERASFTGVVIERFSLEPGAQFVPPPPTVRCDVRLGDHIHLLGYDLTRRELSRSRPVAVTLYWSTTSPVDTSYTGFSHLLGPDGEIWGQHDGIPLGGARPTNTWLPGEVIVERYEIPLSPDAPAGDYSLAVGFYDLLTMERLPVEDAQNRWLSDDRVLIERLSLSSSEQ
jgi:hypothetical protein